MIPRQGRAPCPSCPAARPPAPRPAAIARRRRAAGSLILQTSLFGPLSVPDGAGRAAELEELSRRAAIYATRARGDGTRRAYRSAWRSFEAWCHSLGREPLAADPDTIAMYVVRCADQGFAVSSIRVHLAAIRTAHLLAGLSLDLRHPRLAMVVEGVTRAKGGRPRRQAAPAVPGVLRLMIAARPSPDTPLGARDRAMLLVGFGAALRRSELVALTLGDVETVPGRGLRCWCAARRPTSTARARTSPSGPTPTSRASARSPRSRLAGPPAHRRRSRLDRQRRVARRAAAVLRRQQDRPGHRRQRCPTRRSPAWSSRPRWMPASTRSAIPGTACAPGSPPPPATRAPASPS